MAQRILVTQHVQMQMLLAGFTQEQKQKLDLCRHVNKGLDLIFVNRT